MTAATIAQMVSENYKTASIFKKFGIDFCCGGKITIAEACAKNKVDMPQLLAALKETSREHHESDSAQNLELDALVEHIVQKHHIYVLNRIPEIEPFLAKVIRVHGDKHPELARVGELFTMVKNELLSHMQKEEQCLFPFIKELVDAKRNNKKVAPPHFGTIQNPITVMESEHIHAGDALKELRKITNNLTPPEGACNTYRVTFSMLDEFENDLHRHIHLENNILFPKAIVLEQKIVDRKTK